MRITTLRWNLLLFIFPMFLGCIDGSSDGSAEQLAAERTPIIQNSSPNHISIFGGTSLMIEGDLFDKGVQVSFGDVPAQQVEWISATSLRVVSPPLLGKSGPVSLKLTNQLEEQPYSATRDDLLVAAVPALKLGTPVVSGVKSPSVIRTISLLSGLDGLLVFSQDDNKIHMLIFDPAKKELRDKTLAIDFSADGFSSLLVGDVNGDGLEDVLASSDAGRVITLLNNGLGSLESTPSEHLTSIAGLVLHAIGSFDEGKTMDLLYSSGKMIGVLLNQQGSGWKSTRTTDIGAAPRHMDFVDVNQDGYLDAVFAQNGNLYVMQCVRGMALQIPYIVSTQMQVDDVGIEKRNGNGVYFVVSGYRASSNQYELVKASIDGGNWKEVMGVQLEEQTVMMEIRDVNGDGLVDAFLTPFGVGSRLFLGDVGNIMQKSIELQEPKIVQAMQAFDINGDYKPDLVLVEQTQTGTRLVLIPNQSI